MKKVNRLGIFSVDNPGAGIGQEMCYLIREIMKCLDELIVVCNGEITEQEFEKISQFTKHIYQSVSGYDANRWQYILKEVYQFSFSSNLDEIVLFNDSFFGPFYPFEDAFTKMSKRKVDFWGMTAHSRIPVNKEENWPRFLQTYFLVIRRRMFRNEVFRRFWKELVPIHSIQEYEEQFEYIFTKKFEDYGFHWESYVDTEDMEPEDSIQYMNFLLFAPLELIKNRKLPILSKYIFNVERDTMLCFHDCSEIPKVINYICDNTAYDVTFIYEYLLHNYNMYDIQNTLDLTYILPKQNRNTDLPEKCPRVIVFAHLFYSDLFEYCINYFLNLPSFADIFITTDSDRKKKEIIKKIRQKKLKNKTKVCVVQAVGREWSSYLMVGGEVIKSYDLACFIHDKKSSQMFYGTVGKSFCDTLWDNTIGGQGYVQEIIDLFEKYPSLGLLSPPGIYHGTFFHTSIDYWTVCYEGTIELLDRLGVSVPISSQKPPVSLGSVFWCRVPAVGALFEYPFEYDDFPQEPMAVDGTFNHCLERIVPYVVQAEGYLSGIVMNSDYASNDITNRKIILETLLKELNNSNDLCLATFYDTVRTLKKAIGERIKN